MSPFEALYGRPPPTIQRYISGSTSNDILDRDLIQRDVLLNHLKGNLQKAQQQMKHQADKKRKELKKEENLIITGMFKL